MSDLTELEKRAEDLIAPVPGASATGQVARFDPRYEAVLAEVAKLDSPTGGQPNWKMVADTGSDLLKTTTKDLLIAAHVGHALGETGGLRGLHVGLLTLTGLIEQHWEKLFPELKRMRGRASALTWFLERAVPRVESYPVDAGDRALVAAGKTVTSKLAGLIGDKMGNDAPAVRPLATAFERLELSLPPEAPPPPPPPDPSAAPPPPVAAAETAAPAPAAALPAVAAPTLAAGADPAAFLSDFGESLSNVGSELRRADPAGSAAYRVLRSGLWLHFTHAPPMTGGRSSVPGPPEALRNQLSLMLTHQKWPELVEECESAIKQYRLWLDLNRISAQALGGMGLSAGRKAVIDELGAFLRRVPDVRHLVFADGTPVADPSTAAWLDAEVLVGEGNGKAGAGDDPSVEALGEARKLAGSGQLTDGVALLQKLVQSSAPGQGRFRARLALARLLVEGAQLDVARAHFSALDEEIRRYGLEDWDPALAAECVSGHLQCARELVKAGRMNEQEPGVLYDRLCRLDPVTALRGG